MQLDIIEGRRLRAECRPWSGRKLKLAPPHSTSMCVEPPPFQRFSPVNIGEAVGSGVAQEFVPLVLQGESGHGIGSPATEIVGDQ
jgi:hypothetical protein